MREHTTMVVNGGKRVYNVGLREITYTNLLFDLFGSVPPFTDLLV